MGKNDQTRMLSVRLPLDVRQALVDEASSEDRTIQGQLVRILRERYGLSHPTEHGKQRRSERR